MVKTLEDFERNPGDIKEVREWAEEIMGFIFTRSQEELLKNQSVDTGFLLRSGRPPFWEENTISIEYDAPYACVVGSRQKVKISPKLYKEIGNLKVGGKVLSKDGDYHRIHKTINNLRVKDKPQLILLQCEKSRTKSGLLVTSDHLILTKANNYLFWEEAGKLRKGDYVFRPKKIPYNKGTRKYLTLKCMYCEKYFEVIQNKSKINTKYCSQKCFHKHTPHNHALGKKWKLSEEQRKKHCGERNSAWKGGITKLPYGPEWNDLLKEKVKIRDNHTCQECGLIELESKYTFHVHHKDANKFNNSINNLITLCPSCHGKMQFIDAELVTIDLNIFEEVKLIKVEKINAFNNYNKKGSLQKTKLYDLSITGENSFVVGGMLVHNSSVEFGQVPHKISYKVLLGWVNRKLHIRGKKGISVSWAIAKTIERNGILPRPYIRPALLEAEIKYKLNIELPAISEKADQTFE